MQLPSDSAPKLFSHHKHYNASDNIKHHAAALAATKYSLRYSVYTLLNTFFKFGLLVETMS